MFPFFFLFLFFFPSSFFPRLGVIARRLGFFFAKLVLLFVASKLFGGVSKKPVGWTGGFLLSSSMAISMLAIISCSLWKLTMPESIFGMSKLYTELNVKVASFPGLCPL